MKPSNGQGPSDNEDFSDAAMIESSLQDSPQSWQDSGAPVDDFNDPAAEGVAQVSEASERMDEESAAGEAESSNKKNARWLPIAAGVGGAIFIGAMLYLQFGNASSTSPVALLPQKPASRAELAAQTAEPSNAVAPTSSLTPLVAANAPTTAPSASASPSSSAEQKGVALPGIGTARLTPPPATPPAASAAETSAVPQEVKAQREETQALAPLQQVSKPLEWDARPPAPAAEPPLQPAQEAPKAATTNEPAPSNDGSRVAALNAQIDALQKELATTQQQLARATSRLEDMHSEKTRRQAPTLSVGGEDLSKVEEKSALLSSAKKRKSSTESQATAARKASTLKRKANTQASTWVLRAASPDEAWVAKGEDSRAIHPVRVGDTLQGVGRVTAIRQDGAEWIVEGTHGFVR